MPNQASQFAVAFDHLAREVLAQLRGLPDRALYWPPPLPTGVSLFTLASELVKEGEVWILSIVGGEHLAKEDDAEGLIKGGWLGLTVRYERWLSATHQVLDYLPDLMLDQFVIIPPSVQKPFGSELVTIRDCLLYTLGRISWLAGYLQFLRELLGDGKRMLREVAQMHELSISQEDDWGLTLN